MEHNAPTTKAADEQILIEFFKTFADINRIRLAAALSESALTVEQMASQLSLRAVEIPRHLARLEALELITQSGDAYRFDRKRFEALTREVLSQHRARPQEGSNDENADDYERKVVKNYSLPDGRLREIPLQERKLVAILKHVVQVIEPGTRFTEKQINEKLATFNEDYATLRRALVDHQMIQREVNGTVYWRAEGEQN